MRCLTGWLLCLAVTAGAFRPAQAADDTGNTRLDLRIPAQHPYLALTPEDVSRASQRAAKFPWARESLKRCAAEADGLVAKPWGKLPEKGDTEHWKIGSRLFACGLVHALTGQKRYAEWTRDGLLAYADLYPQLPLTRGRCKLFSQSSLYEALWVVSVVQAYDLVADSGVFSPQQKQRVENDLLRASVACFRVTDFTADPRIKDLHYRCYNFQAWHLSAVGLVGLALRDPELVQYAINSPYGFRHLVAHDIRDDGLFWERSVGYHHFVISALLPWMEAMVHCGVDLYALQVPNDRSRDEGVHYVTDTSDRPKSFRLMFEAPFYLAFPDLTYPALGDSDRGPLHGGWTHLVAYHRYHDPRLAWLVTRDTHLRSTPIDRGRVGFLHYYRYAYRYDDLRLDGKPVAWDRQDTTYECCDGRVTASDGGTSQSDRYLLGRDDVKDFVFEWTMTRLADSGRADRAWLVFHVDRQTPAYRKSFALAHHCPQVNRPYRFRLEVSGDRQQLFRDGRPVASGSTESFVVPDWRWLIYDLPPDSADKPLELGSPDGTFANSGRYQNGCSLLPSSGVAILRQAFTQQPEATAASLSYGPYGGGHGHPDKLNLVVDAQGRQWIPDFGSMPYETRWKSEWTAHTVSHNTLVVDGLSQRPSVNRDSQWPVDDAKTRVLGKLEGFDPAHKRVSASCDRMYEGLLCRRTVQLQDHYVIDQLDVGPTTDHRDPSPHQFDYVLHVDGALRHATLPLAARSGPLGKGCGYQYVQQQQSGVLSREPMALTFEAAGKQLRLWVVPPAESSTEVILAEGLTNSPEVKMPMLVLRRKAASTRFLTVIEPVKPDDPIRAVRLQTPAGKDPPSLVLQRTSGTQRLLLP